jgi:hypothetical protein
MFGLPAHVRSALDVVLPPQGIDASPWLTQIPSEQRKIHQAHHTRCALNMFGQAEPMDA